MFQPTPVNALLKTAAPSCLVLAIALAPAKLLAESVPTPQTTTPRLGCLSGYPDSTFRGDRAVTRYEFAAGLHACLEQINQLLTNPNEFATRSDLDVLIQRQRELNDQIRELNDRTDRLDQ